MRRSMFGGGAVGVRFCETPGADRESLKCLVLI